MGGSAIRLQATTVNGIGSGSVTIANGSQVFFSTGGTYTNTFNIAGVGTGTDVPPFGAVRLANTQTLTGPINLTGNALIDQHERVQHGDYQRADQRRWKYADTSIWNVHV